MLTAKHCLLYFTYLACFRIALRGANTASCTRHYPKVVVNGTEPAASTNKLGLLTHSVRSNLARAHEIWGSIGLYKLKRM